MAATPLPRRLVYWRAGLAGLRRRLPCRGQILDLGCGCGVPAARHLTAAGDQASGVDIRDVQIERARRLS